MTFVLHIACETAREAGMMERSKRADGDATRRVSGAAMYRARLTLTLTAYLHSFDAHFLYFDLSSRGHRGGNRENRKRRDDPVLATKG